MEPQAVVALESRVVLADVVDQRDQLAQAVGALQVPASELILLRIEVFLGALLARLVLTELEGRSIDAVARTQGGSQDQPGDERRSAAGLEVLSQDVRGVGPQAGAKKLAHGRLGQLGEVLTQLPAAVAPGEVGIGLAEAQLGQPVHDLRPRERLGQEDHVRLALFHFRDQPLPEVERLGMRIVHPEGAHPLIHPEHEDAQELLPELAPVLGLEVKRVDILVFLRRVLRVLDRAVRPSGKPFRVLTQIGMIRGTLERDVECNLQPTLASGLNQVFEVSQGSELGMDRLMPTLPGPDRPRAAGVLRTGLEAVIPTLSMGSTDRVNRSQVQDIEAHPGDILQPGFDILEGPVLTA